MIFYALPKNLPFDEGQVFFVGLYGSCMGEACSNDASLRAGPSGLLMCGHLFKPHAEAWGYNR